ncbi:hypothetical protein HK099_005069 [Clydaea vesicula]|uniref:DUF642 domain-containing protein n=1 Tax=Clydaea vesicula TaxID=447962 RepID=A0AAD5XV81_9FUNG|nr:hypothetical protein HK099_005069 [Clydaea vesicula]KAJ3394614.1 hypothetical protein HDU92_006719 [Lobulomyces angularis]
MLLKNLLSLSAFYTIATVSAAEAPQSIRSVFKRSPLEEPVYSYTTTPPANSFYCADNNGHVTSLSHDTTFQPQVPNTGFCCLYGYLVDQAGTGCYNIPQCDAATSFNCQGGWNDKVHQPLNYYSYGVPTGCCCNWDKISIPGQAACGNKGNKKCALTFDEWTSYPSSNAWSTFYTNFFKSSTPIKSILNNNNFKGYYYVLAREWIAASLNVNSGSDYNEEVAVALKIATAFLSEKSAAASLNNFLPANNDNTYAAGYQYTYVDGTTFTLGQLFYTLNSFNNGKTTAAKCNLVNDGGFENGPLYCPQVTSQGWCIANPSVVPNAWSATQNMIELDKFVVPIQSGDWATDLNPNNQGSISQTVSNLNPNYSYTLSFWLNANPCGGNSYPGYFSVNGVSTNFNYNLNQPYQFISKSFSNLGTSANIVIGSSKPSSGCGPVIDNVQLIANPILSTI